MKDLSVQARDALRTVEEQYEWRKWQKEIPYINFDKDWLVRAIPAFHCGVIRYNVQHKKHPDLWVSIYLDCYDQVGCMDEPYWELYPNDDGDCDRFLMADVAGLVGSIRRAFKHQREKK